MSVSTPYEAIDHPFVTLSSRLWKKLVNSTKFIGAIIIGCPKKVARSVKKQTAIRKACVRLTSERINRSKDPFPTLSRLQLENCAFYHKCRQPSPLRKEGHHAEASDRPNRRHRLIRQ